MFSFLSRRPTRMPTSAEALPGRDAPSFAIAAHHAVLGNPLQPPIPAGHAQLMVGMGCFWGAERKLWQLPGVWTTAVGYAQGLTPHPTYQEVCTGMTGHNEVVWVVFDPSVLSLEALLQVFFENHDPTQGMRQGNDVGTQYRSGIYVYDADQRRVAEAVRDAYQQRLTAAGHGRITTEIADAETIYYAEEYHQQYLFKNPNGYCGIGGTGISCPIGLDTDG